MTYAITGATGFVGRALMQRLAQTNTPAVGLSRQDLANGLPPLDGVDVVIHCAGLAHRAGTKAEFDAANHTLAVNTARRAAAAGVRRLVFVSTINVVAANQGQPLDAAMPQRPLSDYGEAKAAAERDLLAVNDIEIAVLRPPLIYGPGALGNLEKLMGLCLSGLPLPFGAVNNARSMASISNVTNAVLHLCGAPKAAVAGKIFHVADAAPLSLRQIVMTARQAMGVPVRLIALPPSLLRLGLSAVGRRQMAEQLVDDLLVDDRTLRETGWQPVSSDDLAAMARDFARTHSRAGGKP